EVKRAIGVNLIYLAPGAEAAIDSSLAFFLSGRSAYVSGQVVRVDRPVSDLISALSDHAGRRVLITGASRGIGEAITRLFVREGAEVIALDVPAADQALQALSAELCVATLAL